MPDLTHGSVPILKLYRDLIVVLQGTLTDAHVDRLKEEIPSWIERYDSLGLVISVSGVDLVDSHLSRTIYDMAMIARLMGVDTVVCGINPLFATTLVEMGLDVGGVATALNVERALEHLSARRRARKAALKALEEGAEDAGAHGEEETKGSPA